MVLHGEALINLIPGGVKQASSFTWAVLRICSLYFLRSLIYNFEALYA